jgi:murein DD-endopeptidase MepM/ murein hydrolase activator NlpD
LATSSGGYITPEVFAIDWLREVNGVLFTGNGSKNRDWPTFGAPLYAVADGTVVRAVDNTRDIPPRSQNPSLRKPEDFGGNHVILKIAPGRYACYAHMKAGSLRVRRGQHVRVGQRIGEVGNSGNTTAPHLHFGVQRRPDCLSESEPFEIDRYKLQGMADPTSTPPNVRIVGTPHRERRSLPLVLSVATLSPADPPRGSAFLRRASGLPFAVIR